MLDPAAALPEAVGPVTETLIEHSGFTEASARGADRARQLTLAGELLHQGRTIDPAWLAAQLWDLRDLLAAAQRGEGCPRCRRSCPRGSCR